MGSEPAPVPGSGGSVSDVPGVPGSSIVGVELDTCELQPVTRAANASALQQRGKAIIEVSRLRLASEVHATCHGGRRANAAARRRKRMPRARRRAPAYRCVELAAAARLG